jgi:uncharacterized protein YndB with AHSA1/START domain
MTKPIVHKPDPKLDLLLERVVDVPRARVWECWTTPRHVLKWFTPAPWKTIECKFDLRPGGRFYTVMQSPEGKTFPNEGCFLEIVKNEKLVIHGDAGDAKKHAEMGFHDGWGKALEQLVAVAKKL